MGRGEANVSPGKNNEVHDLREKELRNPHHEEKQCPHRQSVMCGDHHTPVPAKPEDASKLMNVPADSVAAAPGPIKLQANGSAVVSGNGNGAKSTADKKGVVKNRRRGRG